MLFSLNFKPPLPLFWFQDKHGYFGWNLWVWSWWQQSWRRRTETYHGYVLLAGACTQGFYFLANFSICNLFHVHKLWVEITFFSNCVFSELYCREGLGGSKTCKKKWNSSGRGFYISLNCWGTTLWYILHYSTVKVLYYMIYMLQHPTVDVLSLSIEGDTQLWPWRYRSNIALGVCGRSSYQGYKVASHNV